MEYQIAISPELQISTADFVAAWNEKPECHDMAQAAKTEAQPKGFPVPAELLMDGLIFLAGFAGSIALDIVKDRIKKVIEDLIDKKFAKKETPASKFEVLVIEGSDPPVIVIKEKE